jgi:hypothetical protein
VVVRGADSDPDRGGPDRLIRAGITLSSGAASGAVAGLLAGGDARLDVGVPATTATDGPESLVGPRSWPHGAGELDQRGGDVSARAESGDREAACRQKPDPLDAVAAAHVTDAA